jgi:hypothetical protein
MDLMLCSVPDVPEEVSIQLQRQDFLVRKLILLEPDDDDDEVGARCEQALFGMHTALFEN